MLLLCRFGLFYDVFLDVSKDDEGNLVWDVFFVPLKMYGYI